MKTRRTSTALAVLAGLGLVGTLAACQQQVATVDVGECLDSASLEGEITEIPTVDCTESHDAQVVGKFELADGDFPGDDAIYDEAEAQCVVLFEEFVGISWEESSVPQMSWVPPSEETWNQADDREVICIAELDEPTTESLEDAAI